MNTKQKILTFFLCLGLLSLFLIPTAVLAQTKAPPTIGGINLPTPRFTTTGALILGIINFLLGFAGAFAVFALAYSGIMYITAGGDTSKAENARKNITWAITGIVIVVLALVIVNLTGRILTTNP